MPTRRNALQLLIGATALGWAGAASAEECVDPAKLSSGDQSLRKSLNFKAVSPTPARSCARCVFYTAAAGQCGKCALLSGGAVAAQSVCDSWTVKS